MRSNLIRRDWKYLWIVAAVDLLMSAATLAVGIPWILVILVIPAIALSEGYDFTILGAGPQEFRRVLAGLVRLLVSAAAVALVLQLQEPGWWLLLEAGSLVAAVAIGRMFSRRILWALRRRGEMLVRTVVISGSDDGVKDSIESAFAGDPYTGMTWVGTCGPPKDNRVDEWVHDVQRALESVRADALVVMSGLDLPTDALRRLTRAVELSGVSVYAALGLDGIGSTRLALRPGPDMTLLHVSAPRITGVDRFVKRGFDLVLGSLLLTLSVPVMLVASLFIWMTASNSPLLVQTRIGRLGRPFRCLKLRTMRCGSEAEFERVLGPLPVDPAAYRNDARITRLGRVLRRFSIDELPQLFNVVHGSMSLVGPRPLLPQEYELIAGEFERRQIPKPGITGLWQVSGRKEVPWDERMRLDLDYLETWSLTLDAILLLRTLKAVVVGRGAY
jgi:exopolysaccharide biosynthesis polyprenyl glycosylphosphotransferase